MLIALLSQCLAVRLPLSCIKSTGSCSLGFALHHMFSHGPTRSWLTPDARWLLGECLSLCSSEGKLPESTNSLDPGGETCSTGAGDTLSGGRIVTAPPSPLTLPWKPLVFPGPASASLGTGSSEAYTSVRFASPESPPSNSQ